MSSTGISPYLANAWLGTLNNTPAVIPIQAVQLHVGDPGVPPTLNLSDVTTRMAAAFAAPIDGVITTTGDPPRWLMTAAETIRYISVYDDLDAGNWLFTALLNQPQTVAQGDTLRLGGGVTLTITGIAGT